MRPNASSHPMSVCVCFLPALYCYSSCARYLPIFFAPNVTCVESWIFFVRFAIRHDELKIFVAHRFLCTVWNKNNIIFLEIHKNCAFVFYCRGTTRDMEGNVKRFYIIFSRCLFVCLLHCVLFDDRNEKWSIKKNPASISGRERERGEEPKTATNASE